MATPDLQTVTHSKKVSVRILIISLLAVAVACSKDDNIDNLSPSQSPLPDPTRIEMSYSSGQDWKKAYAYYFESDSSNHTYTVTEYNHQITYPVFVKRKKVFFIG